MKMNSCRFDTWFQADPFLSLSLLDHFVNSVRPETKIELFVFGIVGETLCSFAKREMLIGTLP